MREGVHVHICRSWYIFAHDLLWTPRVYIHKHTRTYTQHTRTHMHRKRTSKLRAAKSLWTIFCCSKYAIPRAAPQILRMYACVWMGVDVCVGVVSEYVLCVVYVRKKTYMSNSCKKDSLERCCCTSDSTLPCSKNSVTVCVCVCV